MRLILNAALAAAAISILSWTNAAIAADAPKPLFASDAVINLAISGPLSGISRDPNAKPVPGVLKVLGSAPETLPIMLSTRGITRRRKDVCTFPPLRVEFTEKPGPTSLFKGQKRLKLVTHCQVSNRNQQYLLVEYTAYKLYQAMTPESFDVRLAKIDYADETGRPIITRIGYFMEDIDDVARRNGQERLRGVNRITEEQLDPTSAARFAVFQYVISNLDWAMTAGAAGLDCCHNSRLLGAKGATTGLTVVPYDFDYSGMVNPPYAVPPDGLHLSNVRIRRYRGFCRNNEQAQAFAGELVARRASLLAILGQTPQLDEGAREDAANYLGDSFDKIAPANVADMLKTCLG